MSQNLRSRDPKTVSNHLTTDSRAVLAWRLSNTMDTSFCIAALDEALARHGKPRIFNTDSQKMVASSRAVCLKHRSTAVDWRRKVPRAT
jgi:transposase InsO family protein